jgi:hypothetical protein
MSWSRKRSDGSDGAWQLQGGKQRTHNHHPCHNIYHGSVPRIHIPTRWRSPCPYDITVLGKSREQVSNTARVPRFILSQFAAVQAIAVSEPWLTVAQRLHNGQCCRFMRGGNTSDTTLYPAKTATTL